MRKLYTFILTEGEKVVPILFSAKPWSVTCEKDFLVLGLYTETILHEDLPIADNLAMKSEHSVGNLVDSYCSHLKSHERNLKEWCSAATFSTFRSCLQPPFTEPLVIAKGKQHTTACSVFRAEKSRGFCCLFSSRYLRTVTIQQRIPFFQTSVFEHCQV